LGFAAVVGFCWLRWHGMPLSEWRRLTDADQYELLSLQPTRLGPKLPDYCGMVILGRMPIPDAATRDRLNWALQSGARQSDGSVYSCFNPRHAIRVTQAGVTTEFLICFECRQVEVRRDGKEVGDFPISSSRQAVFDDVLNEARIPLASKEP
jgi:hypothetical protein